MADIGKLAVTLVANAQPFTQAMASARSAASSTAADVAKSLEKAAGSTPKLDASAIGKSLGLGVNKLVDVSPAASAAASQAKKLAANIKAEYPELAKAAAQAGKALVRVNEDGAASLLRYKNGTLEYVRAEQARGSLSGSLAKDMQAKAEAEKRAAEAARIAAKLPGWARATAATGSRNASGFGLIGGAAGLIGGAAGMAASGFGPVAGAISQAALAMTRLVASTAKWGTLTAGGLIAGGFMLFRSGVNDIMKADRQARELGVTVTELRTLMIAGGAGADAMGQAVGHLGGLFAQARAGQSEALRDFQNLAALSGKRINADVFQASPVEGYRAVLERLAAIPDATQRAAAAFRFFGSAATAIAPELDRGVAGLDRAQKIMKNFGLNVGERDLASVRQVAQTMRELGALWDGFKNQVTIALAPIAAQLSKTFDATNIDISGIQAAVTNLAEGIATAGAVAWEAWSDTSLITDAWNVAAKAIESIFETLVGKLQSQFGKLVQSMAEFAPVGSGYMTEVGKLLEAQGGLAQTEGKRLWRGMTKDAEAFAKRIEGLGAVKGVRGFFGDVRAAHGGKTTTPAGATPPAHLLKLGEEAAAAAKALKDPAEAFEDQMKRIAEMDKAGLFKGNEGLQAKMVQQAFGDAVAKLPQVPQAPGAALKNTREAYSAVEAFRRSETRQDVPGLLKAMKEEAKARQDAANGLLKEIRDALKKDGGGAADDEKVARWEEFF